MSAAEIEAAFASTRETTNVENPMTTLQQKIADRFLVKLAESKNFDSMIIDQLRALLAEGRSLKADDFVKVFSGPVGGDLK